MDGQSKDEMIYVGRRLTLKNRVRQIFRAVGKKVLIFGITRFEYIITVLRSWRPLFLESNLIKGTQAEI